MISTPDIIRSNPIIAGNFGISLNTIAPTNVIIRMFTVKYLCNICTRKDFIEDNT